GFTVVAASVSRVQRAVGFVHVAASLCGSHCAALAMAGAELVAMGSAAVEIARLEAVVAVLVRGDCRVGRLLNARYCESCTITGARRHACTLQRAVRRDSFAQWRRVVGPFVTRASARAGGFRLGDYRRGQRLGGDV